MPEMSGHTQVAARVLNRSYIHDFPLDAAKHVETMPPMEAAVALADQPADAVAPFAEGESLHYQRRTRIEWGRPR